jgi:hypothetical protein
MAEVKFAQNLQRHLSAPSDKVQGSTVGEALQAVVARNPRLRGYLLDDRGQLRKQIVVFINGALIEDRLRLTDPIEPASELYVMQALS